MEEEIKDRFEAEQILKKHGVMVGGKPAGELLMQSARLNLMKIFNFFAKTVPLDYKNKFNDSILHYAAKGGNAEMVQFLISNQIIQTPNLFGELPIFYAAEEGHVNIIELLFDPVIITVRDKFGDTILHFAAREGHDDACKFIIRKRKDLVNAANENGQTPLNYAMENGYLSVAEILQKAGGKMATQ
ncbi:hypothetical protein SteCoe_23844 [Stentor coeruleus]|uniref:Uncharacterized protein n=1 Tax=Stentor coeruleus TaxID=5963 RepID=A0A1R2BIX8_9CILI|nr:hypothetical protein SteCoe_23844 [Stentor coeruleus]